MVSHALISSWAGDRNIRILKMHISTPFSLHLVPAHFHCIATNALSFMPCNICFRVFVPCPWTLLAFWVVIPNTKVGGGQGSHADCGTEIFLEKSKVEKKLRLLRRSKCLYQEYISHTKHRRALAATPMARQCLPAYSARSARQRQELITT
jgi:hypothetical protein